MPPRLPGPAASALYGRGEPASAVHRKHFQFILTTETSPEACAMLTAPGKGAKCKEILRQLSWGRALAGATPANVMLSLEPPFKG